MNGIGVHEKRMEYINELFETLNKIYITKTTLKSGRIKIALLDHIEGNKAYCVAPGGKIVAYKAGEWFLNLEDAKENVEDRKEDMIKRNEIKLQLLKDEIESLKNDEIEIENKNEFMKRYLEYMD